MKKSVISFCTILIFVLLLPLFAFSQRTDNIITSTIDEKQNTVLFGYISDQADEFFLVKRFLESLNIKVIDYCEEECLFFVLLNEENKDYTQLFDKIEKKFNGTCYFKSTENRLMFYKKCYDQQVKKHMGGTK